MRYISGSTLLVVAPARFSGKSEGRDFLTKKREDIKKIFFRALYGW
jgi:hypothetical protein